MIVYHLDRNGHGWRYNLPNCTREQAAAFARCLRSVSRIGGDAHRRGVGFRATPTESKHADWCANMERAILEALADRFPATESDYQTNEFFAL